MATQEKCPVLNRSSLGSSATFSCSAMSDTVEISLPQLISRAGDAQRGTRGEIHPDAVLYVSREVHTSYIEWCKTRPGWQGKSGLAREQQRCIRNRVSAKQSRARNRERVQVLEHEKHQLTQENEWLRNRVAQLSATVQKLQSESPLFSMDMAGTAVYDASGYPITFLLPDVCAQ